MDDVLKFSEYDFTNEKSYTMKDGKFQETEFEIYRDHHPEKFTAVSLKENNQSKIFDTETIWVIKKDEKILAVVSGDLPEESIRQMFDFHNKY